MLKFIRSGLDAALSIDDLTASLARHSSSPPSQVRALAEVIAPFIRAIPDALAFLGRAAKDPQVGRAIEFANSQIVHYLLDEQDLLPEADLGVLGLLDDALLTHYYAGQTLAFYPWLTDVTGEYELPARATLDLVAQLLPAGTADALERTSRSVPTIALTLFGSRLPPGTEVDLPAPVLRVDDALTRVAR